MILTTASLVGDQRVVQHLGIVSGEAILGANIFRDFFAGIRDIVGGRSAGYERSLREAKDTAMREMIQQATALGANAVIGIDIDYETIGVGNGGSMLMVAVSGTAVVCQ
ncbi:heavy metal-binding domain-containing protein [Chroococcidiopsis sp. FACHB-1243]|uniref:heavy metal-binding domain-containing protein n=1 Tax=Chroococcidiopsis sp. [FACHB-1243] TaxID=2692781 RepID=UPI00177ECB3A|nr:heavy metal-binding domain-containing protein [Chroococcidiopsis sp. [FACHB-1243]]MBD2304130.1 heavy metal-binding domain-containing protein [Chroococcidiopsis sp. [FACHB-1243]]